MFWQHWGHRSSLPFGPVSNASVKTAGSAGLASMRIDRADRRIGYSAAAVAATSFAILWVPNFGHSSRGVTGATYLAVGLVLSAFLALATASGRRVLVVLAVLFTTVGPWGPERLFEILYLVLAIWMGVRLFSGLRKAKAGAPAAEPPPVGRTSEAAATTAGSKRVRPDAAGRHRARPPAKRAVVSTHA